MKHVDTDNDYNVRLQVSHDNYVNKQLEKHLLSLIHSFSAYG